MVHVVQFCGDGEGLGWTDTCMPSESKTSVFTSDSIPWAGISSPFHEKVTPAALPTLTTISRLARTVVWAGAIKVSCVTVWPSAVTEIQEFSVARITRLRADAVFAGGAAVRLVSVSDDASLG
jgi:hypothetical protein